MMKINFKQPKYIFPLVVFVPLCALVYFVMQTFGGGGDTRQTVATDRINMELPEANAEEAGDKMTEMSRRFGDEDAFTAVGAIGEEEKDKEELEHGYSEEELNRLDAAEAERIRQQQEMEELERSLAESRKHINSYAYGSSSSGNVSQDDFARDLEEIQRRSYQRQKAIESGLGFGNPEAEEAARKQRADSIAKVRMEEKERNRPNLVVKSSDAGAGKFHTVSAPDEAAEANLIRAMIDQTTKAREGTRLRFKLLDDVTVSGTKLRKGTYLYGTVTGFGGQRVRAAVTSILVGGKFIKVKLSVFDNDGMEGFYVPRIGFQGFREGRWCQHRAAEYQLGVGGRLRLGHFRRGHRPASPTKYVQLRHVRHLFQYPEEQGENQIQHHRLSNQLG